MIWIATGHWVLMDGVSLFQLSLLFGYMNYICSNALLFVTSYIINLRACRSLTMFLIVDHFWFSSGSQQELQVYTNWCKLKANRKSQMGFHQMFFFFFFPALAMGLCVSMIAYIRLPSLKVSTLLLIGLLIYDVFWVSFGYIQLCFYQSFFNCNNIKRLCVPAILSLRLLIPCSCQWI